MKNGWPNKNQMWLLRACLCAGAEAQDAWKTWTRLIDFDQVDPASYKLFSFVSRNPDLQSLQDPIFEKCKGIYRRVWVENQLTWTKILPILNALIQNGIDQIVLLKGMAMILRYYNDFGMRVIGDIDILIGKSHLQIADSYLRANGWKANVTRLDLSNEAHLKRWHALNFTHSSQLKLDLHWSFIQENCLAVDEAVFLSAKSIERGSSALQIPCATDLFFQSCVHGIKYSPVPLIRWIPDAMTILRKSEIDWDRLIDLSHKASVCLPISLALQFLAEEFKASIPNSIIQKMKQSHSLKLEFLEYRWNRRGYGEVADWYRYCLNRKFLTRKKRLLNLPEYLRITARLKSLWQIPFFAIYWIFKRIYYRVFSKPGL